MHGDGRSECTGILLTTGSVYVYDCALGQAEADRRTLEELERLSSVGAQVCTKKTFMPALIREYAAWEIHAVPEPPPGAEAPRPELATVVGKLQSVPPLVVGGQNKLAPLYWARDDFVNPAVAECTPALSSRAHEQESACEHLPGVESGFSDDLSRYVPSKDFSDWQCRRDEFLPVQSMLPRPFTLNVGTDPVGTNAHLPRQCSIADHFLDRHVAGECVYANPDFDLVGQYMQHFLSRQRSSPGDTLGTFVLPPGRKCSGGASEAGGPGGRDLWRGVPVLSGDTQRDCVLLSRVHPTPVRGTRRDYARTHSAGPLWALLGIGGGVAGCRIDHGLDPAGVSDAGPAVPGYSTAEVQRRELCDFVDLRAQSAHRGAWHAELRDLPRAVPIFDGVRKPFDLPQPTKNSARWVLLGVLDKHHKRPSLAKRAWTLAQWCGIYHSGFVLSRRWGRCQQL
eukprot:gene16474-biopygen16986